VLLWLNDNIRTYLIFLETTIIGLHFAADNISLSSLQFLWWVYFCKSDVSALQGHPRSLIIGVNRKCVCDFLLVRNSNVGPILHRFGDFAAFMRSWTHLYSTRILGLFLLHQIADVGTSKRISLKLFGGEIIFEAFQPMWSRYLSVMDGRTDGRIDRRTDDMQSHNRAMRSIAR